MNYVSFICFSRRPYIQAARTTHDVFLLPSPCPCPVSPLSVSLWLHACNCGRRCALFWAKPIQHEWMRCASTRVVGSGSADRLSCVADSCIVAVARRDFLPRPCRVSFSRIARGIGLPRSYVPRWLHPVPCRALIAGDGTGLIDPHTTVRWGNIREK